MWGGMAHLSCIGRRIRPLTLVDIREQNTVAIIPIRIWDVAYDGYVGGKDVSMLDWENDEDVRRFVVADAHLNRPYTGPSLIVLPMPPLTRCAPVCLFTRRAD